MESNAFPWNAKQPNTTRERNVDGKQHTSNKYPTLWPQYLQIPGPPGSNPPRNPVCLSLWIFVGCVLLPSTSLALGDLVVWRCKDEHYCSSIPIMLMSCVYPGGWLCPCWRLSRVIHLILCPLGTSLYVGVLATVGGRFWFSVWFFYILLIASPLIGWSIGLSVFVPDEDW